jgi:hypothetical protein
MNIIVNLSKQREEGRRRKDFFWFRSSVHVRESQISLAPINIVFGRVLLHNTLSFGFCSSTFLVDHGMVVVLRWDGLLNRTTRLPLRQWNE